MRQAFQEELDRLQAQFDQLFELSEQAFAKVQQVLATNQSTLAEAVVAEDSQLNQTQLDIELGGALLLARQQPVTRDLRLIVSLMQMSSDLEKIGDYSALIAKALLKIQGQARSAELESGLTDLGQQVQELSSLVRRLVAGQDWQEFKTVADLETVLVEARKALSATIRRTIDREPDLVISGTYYLSMALHMERMADYLTNICERLVYIETGQLVEKG